MTSFNVLSPLDRAAAEPGLQPALEANQDTLSPNRNLAPLSARLDALGRLEVGGCGLSELGRRYGTPLYVLDEDTLRASCRAYRDALALPLPPGPSLALYASKSQQQPGTQCSSGLGRPGT